MKESGLLFQPTKEQYSAINTQKSRVKILAVAGAGKTTLLRERVRSLLMKGTGKSEILVLTFSNKMAWELKRKIKGLRYVKTFHSMCLTVVKDSLSVIGYDRASVISDKEDDAIKKGIIASGYLKFKNKKILDNWIEMYLGGKVMPPDRNFGIFIKRYMSFMKKEGLLSYLMLEYFAKKAAPFFHQKFKHILIDEYQDTSEIEKDVIDAFRSENVFVVGDVFQNIYSFRGATIKNLLEFPAEEEISMNQTFRCTKQIVEYANHLISLSTLDYPYRLKSERSGGVVENIETSDPIGTIQSIVKKYLMIYDPGEFFILTRTNDQASQVRQALELFPVSKERVDAKSGEPMAQFSAMLSMKENLYYDYSVERFLRIMQDEKSTTIDRWIGEARRGRRKLFDVVIDKSSKFLRYFDIANGQEGLKEKAEKLLRGNYWDFELVESTIALISAYEDKFGDDPAKFIEWLIDGEEIGETDNTIKVMTIHAAKGLENKVVIIPFVQDGVFPNYRSSKEEELRLMYVASTRASEKLMIIRTGDSVFA